MKYSVYALLLAMASGYYATPLLASKDHGHKTASSKSMSAEEKRALLQTKINEKSLQANAEQDAKKKKKLDKQIEKLKQQLAKIK